VTRAAQIRADDDEADTAVAATGAAGATDAPEASGASPLAWDTGANTAVDSDLFASAILSHPGTKPSVATAPKTGTSAESGTRASAAPRAGGTVWVNGRYQRAPSAFSPPVQSTQTVPAPKGLPERRLSPARPSFVPKKFAAVPTGFKF
jgi:hypothetical protein